MARINLKRKLVSHRRQILSLLAVFVAAIIFGYLGESRAVQTSDQVTRKLMLEEMVGIIDRLQAVLKAGPNNRAKIILQADFPQEIARPVKLGLVKNYPDGTWHLEDLLTRGEVVSYFSRTIEFIKQNLSFNQLTAEGLTAYEDIGSGHWLEQDLKGLAGIGATAVFDELRFNPDKNAEVAEIKAISRAIIDYFSSNMLILNKNETHIDVLAKGALKNLDLHEFEVSWDGDTWYKMPVDGKIPVRNSDDISISLFFRHPHFLKVGPVEMPKIGAASAFVKLRREYATFVKDNLVKFSRGIEEDDPIEIARIKDRLDELKKKNQVQNTFEVAAKNMGYSETEAPVANFARPTQENQPRTEKPILVVEELVKPKPAEPMLEKVSKLVRLEGRVCDSLNDQGLEGALLVIDGETQHIDTEGRFSFQGERHRVVEVTVYCEGYSPLQMKHRLGYRSDLLNLKLKPELTVFKGRIVCADSGLAVREALVRVGEKATRTAADGSFQIRGIRPGYHQISCFARNFLEAHEIVFVKNRQTDSFILAVRKDFADEPGEPKVAQPSISWERSEFKDDYSVDFAD